jgi:sugar phosphate isomerase/epimerase
VQFDASGELAPSRLSDSGRRELKTLLRMRGLELTALGCPLRYGLDEAQNQHQRVDTVRDVMTLAYELGPRTVVLQAGQVPESATKGVSQPDTESKSEDDPRARLMRECLGDTGPTRRPCRHDVGSRYGPGIGRVLAVVLKRFELRQFAGQSLAG